MDIELEFSDDTKTPLRDISDTDYHLVVESLDPEVVAFAPMVASHHPRVIAVGEGNGKFECMRNNRLIISFPFQEVVTFCKLPFS